MKKTSAKKRNILTLKNKNGLCENDLLLYDPYKNLVDKFYALTTQKNCKSFDFIARDFNGMDSAEESIKNYYEALLGITSYFQAAKGGRGKYIEKKLSAIHNDCFLGVHVKDLPNLFSHPEITRKAKLYGQISLDKEECSRLRLCEWNFIGSNEDNAIIDLCRIYNNNEKSISFLELKNRIDSGGTAARREFYNKKTLDNLSYFLTNKDLFERKGKKYSLLKFYNYFKVKKITLSLGILFDTNGKYATLKSDKNDGGFFSDNKNGFNALLKFIKANPSVFNIENLNEENFSCKLKLKTGFNIEIRNVYGTEILRYLFDEIKDIKRLFKNNYDDIWLFQLLAIDERHQLLKHGSNMTCYLRDHVRKTSRAKRYLDNFIKTEGKVSLRFKNFMQSITYDKKLIPKNKDPHTYMLDVLYFIAAANGDLNM